MASNEEGTPQLSDIADNYLNPSFVVEGAEGNDTLNEEQKDDTPLREQDRFLPIANVARIMKTSIPSNGKIAKDAKECVQECVSEFISFITSEASERCHQEKRKTINGEDILFAMSTLGFDNFVEPLKLYLQKYRESIKGDKGANPENFEESEAELPGIPAASTVVLDEMTGQPSVIYASYPTAVL